MPIRRRHELSSPPNLTISPKNGSAGNARNASRRCSASFRGIRFSTLPTDLSISMCQFTFELCERNRLSSAEVAARTRNGASLRRSWHVFRYNSRLQRFVLFTSNYNQIVASTECLGYGQRSHTSSIHSLLFVCKTKRREVNHEVTTHTPE